MHSLLAFADLPPAACLAVTPLQVWDNVWPYLLMVLGFSAIIFVHELGHFAVAKWVGVRVDRFAIGFGKELFGFSIGETRYSFNILPVGGYVKMLGQEDFDDKAEELKFKDDPSSFVNKSVGARAAIVSAGVIMNVLFAFFLFMIVFMIGLESVAPRIGVVEPDSPADKAGLLPGDWIHELNGQRMYEFNQVNMAIVLSEPHEPINFVVERNDQALPPILVEPEYRAPESAQEIPRQIVGILPGSTREVLQVGPEMDPSNPSHLRVGDLLAEVDGVTVTDSNATEMLTRVRSGQCEMYVDRPDPDNPDAPPTRVKVDIEPVLGLYQVDRNDPNSVHLLGMRPLVRFHEVPASGRAGLAGIEPGDTVISWDDQLYPTQAQMREAVADQPGRDIAFLVERTDGTRHAGFVRPKHNGRGSGTIHATVGPLDHSPLAVAAESPDTDSPTDDADDASGDSDGAVMEAAGPRAAFLSVRLGGVAARAGLDPGDAILAFAGVRDPTSGQINRIIQERRGEALPITVRKPGGLEVQTEVTPAAPGTIQATFGLTAETVLIVGDVVPTAFGEPTPAAEAGIPVGAWLLTLNGEPIPHWRGLIDMFRAHAGQTVRLAYRDPDGNRQVTDFDVPRCLKTELGIGPAGHIVKINDSKTVEILTDRGKEKVSVAYPDGTRAALAQLVGQTDVEVAYRDDLLGPLHVKKIDVTPDMVDPWLSRVALQSNVITKPEMTLLKGENAFDAIRIGIDKTHYFVLQVYVLMQRMIFSRSVGLESMSGPLGIVDMGGQIARTDGVRFLFFLAILSANLAVINFLPLPIVDGGLMVFLIIEKIKGSPVSLRVQVATQIIGLFLIVGAFVYVTFNDVMRMFG